MTEVSNSNVPQNALTIIGALENLGWEVAYKSEEISLEIIELFGKEVINLMSEGIEDIIEFAFPGIKDKDVLEITAQAREKVMKILELIQAINEDEILKQDVKMILQLVSSAAGDMLLTMVNDMEQPVEEAVDKFVNTTEEIAAESLKGLVRTTWDTFLLALDPIPVVGEIGGLVNVVNSIFETAVKVAPPAIENIGSAIELGNNFVSTALNIGNEYVNKLNEIKGRANDAQNRILSIQERIAGKIQSAADGVAAFGSPNIKTRMNIPTKVPTSDVKGTMDKRKKVLKSKSKSQLPSSGGKRSKKSRVKHRRSGCRRGTRRLAR